jgi:hypothetical protein
VQSSALGDPASLLEIHPERGEPLADKWMHPADLIAVGGVLGDKSGAEG